MDDTLIISITGMISGLAGMGASYFNYRKQQKDKATAETKVEEARLHVEQKTEETKQQVTAEVKAEARLTIHEAFAMYESTVSELRAEIRELKHKEDLHKNQLTKLQREMATCEETSADLKKQVQKYQTENAGLNAHLARLIDEIVTLNGTLKDQAMKLRR